MPTSPQKTIGNCFRGLLPVVVDVETAGFNAEADALLEVGCVFLDYIDGTFIRGHSFFAAVLPFANAHLDPSALKFLRMPDPWDDRRQACEEAVAIRQLAINIADALIRHGCKKALLVGHNPSFDLAFMQAAFSRCDMELPFHAFTTLDTATLGAVCYGQTTLPKIARAAGLRWQQTRAHNALYDAQLTADLFCQMLNESIITPP